jgi:monovalent cation:proton antiporter-2 (CPA2) family protein
VDFFTEAALFLGAATIIVPVFRRFGLGDVLGYLGAGLLIGPWGLEFIDHPEEILHFAEIGVVFLLFIIGLELQPSRLWVFRKLLLGLGGLQVLITMAAIALVTRFLGQDWTVAVVIGCALSLSSTAFVLQIMAERQELMKPHGRAAFAILLFQDLAVIPMLAMTSAFSAGSTVSADADTLLEFGRVILVLAAFVGAGRYLLRPLLRFIAGVGAQEVFTAAALFMVLGSGLLLESLGLSMGLGAFIAGVLVADSEFRHQLEADIVPFKGLLLGLFFMVVGMSANIGLLMNQPLMILLATAGLILGKALILYPLARLFGLSGSCSMRMAILLAQGGEFAFVILAAGVGGDVIGKGISDFLVLVVTLSMVATPILVTLEARLRERAATVTDQRPFDEIDAGGSHVVIAGFGRFGQIIGRVLTSQGIPYTALDINPEHVDLVRRYGNKTFYGDASQLPVLKSADVAHARLFILAVGNIEASAKIAKQVKHHYPGVQVFARARNRRHVLMLRELGCEVIMRDTFLSSLYVAEQVLTGLGYEEQAAHDLVETFKDHDVEILDQQFAVRDDEEALIQSGIEASKELRQLFQSDTGK